MHGESVIMQTQSLSGNRWPCARRTSGFDSSRSFRVESRAMKCSRCHLSVDLHLSYPPFHEQRAVALHIHLLILMVVIISTLRRNLGYSSTTSCIVCLPFDWRRRKQKKTLAGLDDATRHGRRPAHALKADTPTAPPPNSTSILKPVSFFSL
jgi:hypothetical protein